MVVQGMMKLCDKVIIVVCCGDKKGDDDLFSTEDVREMISAALLDEDIIDAEIHVLQDCPADDLWVGQLKDLGEGRAVQIWSGKADVLAAAETAGLAIKKVVPVPGHDGADIRAQIKAEDHAWEKKVTKPVADVVRKTFK